MLGEMDRQSTDARSLLDAGFDVRWPRRTADLAAATSRFKKTMLGGFQSDAREDDSMSYCPHSNARGVLAPSHQGQKFACEARESARLTRQSERCGQPGVDAILFPFSLKCIIRRKPIFPYQATY